MVESLDHNARDQSMATGTGGRLATRLARVAALLVAVAVTVIVFSLRDAIAVNARLGLGGIFLFMVVTNATLILPLPGWAVIFLVGGTLNPFLLAVVAAAGASLGETTGYLAGYGGRGVIDNRAWYARVVHIMERYGAWVVVALGALPNPIFDLGGIAAGALKMPLWKFLLAATLGKSLRFLVVALAGAWVTL